MTRKLIPAVAMLILFALLLSGLPAQQAEASPGWWGTNWSCRKAITISNSLASALTDYQVKIVISYESAMQADFDDLRFANASDATLDYWLESKTDGSSATVWVEVDSIAASGDTTIYMYYGNPAASSESNGVNTFDFFDDFEDGSISGSYTRIGYDGWSEDGGVLTFTTGGTTQIDPNVLKIDNKTYDWGYEIRGKIRVRQWQDHDFSRMGLGLRTRAADAFGYKGLFHYSGGKTRAVLHDWVAWLSNSAFAWSLDTWYWIGFYARLDGSTRYLYEKDWSVGSNEPVSWILTPSNTNTTNQDGQPCIAGSSIPSGGFSTQFIGDWDDVFVRKCVYPAEPTCSVGSEECLPTVTIDVSDTLINEADDGGTFDVVANFSKAMDTGVLPTIGFDPDVVASGTLTFASDAWSGGDTVYTATYVVTDVDKEVADIDVSVGGAEDLAGNPQDPDPTTEADLFDVDTVAPTVAITSIAPDPTGTSPIPMTALFSEDVTGFELGDITVGNGAADNFVAVSDAEYTFDVTPVTDGLVTVDIAGGVAQDGAGNPNAAAPQFSIAYDTTAPTVVITSTATDPTNVSPIPMTATFSEDVIGFELGDITVGNGTAGNFAGSGSVYTFDVTPVADGLVTVDIAAGVAQDEGGNPNTAAVQFSVAYDATAQTGGSTKDKYSTRKDVYVTASGFLPDSDVDVYVVNDRAWTDGDPIPADVGDGMDTIHTDSEGNLGPVEIWSMPLEPGEYDIVFDADQNGDYDELWDLVDHPNHPGFTVVSPTVGGEVYPINKAAILMPWIGLGAVLILTASCLILVRRRSHK